MSVPASYLLLFSIVYPLLVGLLLAIHVRCALATHPGARPHDDGLRHQTAAQMNALPTNETGRWPATNATPNHVPADRGPEELHAGHAAWATVTAPSDTSQRGKPRRYTLCLN